MFDTCDIRVVPEQMFAIPKMDALCGQVATLRKEFGLRTLQVYHFKDRSLVVSFSIPQALYGSSMDEYHPRDSALLKSFLEGLFDELGIGILDISVLRLCRLDICRNLEVSQPASQFIAHGSRYAPRRVTVITAGSAWVSFRWSKRESLSLYDKELKEYRRPGGHTLRIELQLKSGQLVRDVAGISTLEDLLLLKPGVGDALLGSMLEDLIDVPDLPTSVSPSDLWRSAALRRTRSVAPLFAAFYLGSIANPSASDLKAMKEQLRSSLSEKTYRQEKAAILDLVAAIPMDSIFRREVLGQLQEKAVSCPLR